MKKVYKRPTMKVVKLKHQTLLQQLSAQARSMGVQNYNWNTEVDE